MGIIEYFHINLPALNFVNFRFLGNNFDPIADAMLYDFEKVKVLVYSNGDIEISSPIYDAMIEKLDYSSIEDALLRTKKNLDYLDQNYIRLCEKPELTSALSTQISKWFLSLLKSKK